MPSFLIYFIFASLPVHLSSELLDYILLSTRNGHLRNSQFLGYSRLRSVFDESFFKYISVIFTEIFQHFSYDLVYLYTFISQIFESYVFLQRVIFVLLGSARRGIFSEIR